ncbi:MAG: PAS domain-containing sensor histidine kinase [Halobacteriales archaeon]|nr:PAS domain-containing sensor histidine kinase [Halobacteriales archaeon]
MSPATQVTASLVGAGFEAMPTQLAILDEGGDIVYTNRAWREFGEENGLGESADCIGENYLGVCTASEDADADNALSGLEAVIRGEQDGFSMEYPCHSPEERRWFTMRAVGFSHDHDRFVLVIHLNITDRKLAEERVSRHNERLETLAGVLSHDIRNPLSVAKGRAMMLDEEVDSVHIEPIQLALDRTQAIIDDSLVLARQTSVEDTQSVDLADQAQDGWSHVETGDASLVIEDSMTLEADPDLLGHIFENLFRNAIEHAGGAPTVEVGTYPGGFYVADDGPGIPENVRDEIFDTGYTSSETGTGFGLSIVARVADAHGWDVTVTDSESGGARFDVRTTKGR